MRSACRIQLTSEAGRGLKGSCQSAGVRESGSAAQQSSPAHPPGRNAPHSPEQGKTAQGLPFTCSATNIFTNASRWRKRTNPDSNQAHTLHTPRSWSHGRISINRLLPKYTVILTINLSLWIQAKQICHRAMCVRLERDVIFVSLHHVRQKRLD